MSGPRPDPSALREFSQPSCHNDEIGYGNHRQIGQRGRNSRRHDACRGLMGAHPASRARGSIRREMERRREHTTDLQAARPLMGKLGRAGGSECDRGDRRRK